MAQVIVMTTNDIINFFSVKKEYRSLSNFWEKDVIVNGRLYESGEHCFHGEKYIRISEHSDTTRKKELIEYVFVISNICLMSATMSVNSG